MPLAWSPLAGVWRGDDLLKCAKRHSYRGLTIMGLHSPAHISPILYLPILYVRLGEVVAGVSMLRFRIGRVGL